MALPRTRPSTAITQCTCLCQQTQPTTRSFTTTPPTHAIHNKLAKILKGVPPYPYPIRRDYKKSWTGLFGGKSIRFGNNVPEQGFTITRRTWRPNVQPKNYWSDSLGEMIKVRVVTSVMRSIEKSGGIDKYLLGEKTARVKELGPMGWKLRWRIINTPRTQKAFAEERKKLGLLGPMRKLELKGVANVKNPIAYRLPTKREMWRDYGYERGATKGASIVVFEAEREEGHVDEVRMGVTEEVQSGEVQSVVLDSGEVESVPHVEEELKAELESKIAGVQARHEEKFEVVDEKIEKERHMDDVSTSGVNMNQLEMGNKLEDGEVDTVKTIPLEGEMQTRNPELEGSLPAVKEEDILAADVQMPADIPSAEAIKTSATSGSAPVVTSGVPPMPSHREPASITPEIIATSSSEIQMPSATLPSEAVNIPASTVIPDTPISSTSSESSSSSIPTSTEVKK